MTDAGTAGSWSDLASAPSDEPGIGPLDSEDWEVPPVATGSVTIVSGRDFAISDGAGDMMPGAVHGLLHSDRRYLHEWTLSVAGYE
ncbi:MAG TPA: glycogen debranching N-terminal domain-containing protein, partial [Ilumatobacteraceae bacterium]